MTTLYQVPYESTLHATFGRFFFDFVSENKTFQDF